MGSVKQDRNEITVRERERSVLELRRQGYTFRTIADMLGYSDGGGAHKAFRRALDRLIPDEVPQELRRLELERLDAMSRRCWEVLDHPDATHRDTLAAVATMLRIMERRSKMLGLDQPKGVIAVSAQTEGSKPVSIIEEIMQLIDGG